MLQFIIVSHLSHQIHHIRAKVIFLFSTFIAEIVAQLCHFARAFTSKPVLGPHNCCNDDNNRLTTTITTVKTTTASPGRTWTKLSEIKIVKPGYQRSFEEVVETRQIERIKTKGQRARIPNDIFPRKLNKYKAPHDPLHRHHRPSPRIGREPVPRWAVDAKLTWWHVAARPNVRAGQQQPTTATTPAAEASSGLLTTIIWWIQPNHRSERNRCQAVAAQHFRQRRRGRGRGGTGGSPGRRADPAAGECDSLGFCKATILYILRLESNSSKQLYNGQWIIAF